MLDFIILTYGEPGVLVEVIIGGTGSCRVRTSQEGVMQADIPADDYQTACAYAQGLAAGYNMNVGEKGKARVAYRYGELIDEATRPVH